MDVDRSVVSVKNEAIADNKSSNWFLSGSNAGSLRQTLPEEKSFSKMFVCNSTAKYSVLSDRNVREGVILEQGSMMVKCSDVPATYKCSNVSNEALQEGSEELLRPCGFRRTSESLKRRVQSPADSDRMKALANIPHVNLGGERFVLADERIIIDAKETKSSDDSLLASADVVDKELEECRWKPMRGCYLFMQPSSIKAVAWQSCYCNLPKKFSGSWRMEILSFPKK